MKDFSHIESDKTHFGITLFITFLFVVFYIMVVELFFIEERFETIQGKWLKLLDRIILLAILFLIFKLRSSLYKKENYLSVIKSFRNLRKFYSIFILLISLPTLFFIIKYSFFEELIDPRIEEEKRTAELVEELNSFKIDTIYDSNNTSIAYLINSALRGEMGFWSKTILRNNEFEISFPLFHVFEDSLYEQKSTFNTKTYRLSLNLSKILANNPNTEFVSYDSNLYYELFYYKTLNIENLDDIELMYQEAIENFIDRYDAEIVNKTELDTLKFNKVNVQFKTSKMMATVNYHFYNQYFYKLFVLSEPNSTPNYSMEKYFESFEKIK